MPICIECRYPVPQLYHVSTSSKSSARPASPTSPPPGGESQRSNTGPGDVRLTQCPRCKRFADKYVEHDFVVLFIDLVLVKPQVYRHLLFNRLGREDDAFDVSLLQVTIRAARQAAKHSTDMLYQSLAINHPSRLSTTPLRCLYYLVSRRVPPPANHRILSDPHAPDSLPIHVLPHSLRLDDSISASCGPVSSTAAVDQASSICTSPQHR